MRKKTIKCLLLIVFSVSQVSAQQAIWAENYDSALKTAQMTGKPVLLDFTASWCAPCRVMEKTFWNRADVGELSKAIIFVKIDSDKNAELRRKYSVRGLPTVILTDPWGKTIDSHLGFGQNSDSVIIEKMIKLPKDFSVLREAGEVLQKDTESLDSLYKYAEFYQQKQMFAYSIPLYQKILLLEAEPSKRENTMLNLAFNHLRLGQSTAALEKFDTLIKEFPKSPQTDMFLYGIILAHLNKQNPSEADAHFGKLKINFPQSPFVRQAQVKIEDYKGRKPGQAK